MEQSSHEVAFLDRDVCGAALGVFRFERPEGYSFLPGQFGSWTLETREGAQTKHFTHSQAPDDPYLEIATRLTGSAFKDALLALSPGDVVTCNGPRGRLVLEPGVRKVAFLAGGVGVTPARSIIRDAVTRGTGLRVCLFHGSRDLECVPFREEFEGYAASRQARVLLVQVLEDPPEGWTGETGFITTETVSRHVDPQDGWRWVVAGPPSMLNAMRPVVDSLGVPPDRVLIESFGGYA